MLFLTFEMAMHYGFWEDYNSRGDPCKLLYRDNPLLLKLIAETTLALALMIILAILSAGRNSLSFFLLLIVSLGYGVVR